MLLHSLDLEAPARSKCAKDREQRTNKKANKTTARPHARTNDRMNEWMNERTNERTSERASERASQRTNEPRRNESRNEKTNEPTNQRIQQYTTFCLRVSTTANEHSETGDDPLQPQHNVTTHSRILKAVGNCFRKSTNSSRSNSSSPELSACCVFFHIFQFVVVWIDTREL